MRRLALVAFGLALCSAGFAQAHPFGIVGDPGQVAQVEQSLAACPSLAPVLDGLVKTAGFRQIRVTTPDEVKRTGPFRAAVSGDEMLLASDWLAEQKMPFFDVRSPGEILPDNLCFDLAHLAEHVAHPAPRPTPGTDFKTWVDARIRTESLAYLRAWPFVLEAARRKNSGKQLTGAQAGLLLLNLRYRFAFMLAMRADANPKLQVGDTGEIPETDANVAAVSAALSNATIADLQ